MCGRMNVIDNPELMQLLRKLGITLPSSDPSSAIKLPLYNLGPGDLIPVVFEQNGKQHLYPAVWWYLMQKTDTGLSPNYKVTSFNARAQRLNSSRLWQDAFRFRRCIIPASAYYEFVSRDKKKYPYMIEPIGQALALAGLYRTWRLGERLLHSAAVITTDGHPKLTDIHEKSLPVMLPESEWAQWLDSSMNNTRHLQSVFEPRLRHDLRVTATDPKYNSTRIKDAGCMQGVSKSRIIAAD